MYVYIMGKLYECDFCHKVFNQKKNLDNHMNKRVPCTIEKENNNFKCPCCFKLFTRYCNLKNHLELICKVKQNQENNDDKLDKIKNLENVILELKKEMTEIKKKNFEGDNLSITNTNSNIINDENILKEFLEFKQKELLKLNQNTNSNNSLTHSSINSNNNINNIDNSIKTQQNVFFTNYTGNGMPPLSVEDIEPILKRGFQIPIELTRAIHFNPKYPEYHNIYLPKPDEKRAMVFRDGMWKSINRDDIIDDLYEHKRAYVVENLDKYKEKLNTAKQKSLQRWLDAEETDQSVINTKKDLQYLLYDNRHIVIGRKKKYEKNITNY
jgi:hypothetical protein